MAKTMSKAGKNLDAKTIIDTVIGITNKVQVDMVHKDEFLDLRAETGGILSTINTLTVFKTDQEQKQVSDHY